MVFSVLPVLFGFDPFHTEEETDFFKEDEIISALLEMMELLMVEQALFSPHFKPVNSTLFSSEVSRRQGTYRTGTGTRRPISY